MIPVHLFSIPVTVVTVTDTGAVDEYGNPTEETSTVTAWGEIQQQTRTDESGQTQVTTEDLRLFLEPGVTVTGWDRVEALDQTFEVIGPPWRVRNPRTGRVSHVEATLRRTT